MLERLKRAANRLKQELAVLSYAIEDPTIPCHLKWGIFALIAYTVSPIDLIPDFLPVIGLLDDLLLVPLGVYFLIRSIPEGSCCKHDDDLNNKDLGPFRCSDVMVYPSSSSVGEFSSYS